ncbi:hypothetical protein Bca52824_023579 [Brassica carinata]|uniref:AGC-kinase C-terminal domain-containing protein n=1 Tax=Brassica carinata TaxID=52824 RepID=A0A8X8AUL0_BRACI|nr:hypothetical protein Bca52824_023579 [Brassica carinata]
MRRCLSKVTPRQMGFTSSNSFLVGSGSVSRTITTTSNAAQVDQTRHSSVSDKLIDSCPLKVWSLLLGLSCCRSPQLRTLQLMGIAVLYLSSHLSPFLCAAYLIIVKGFSSKSFLCSVNNDEEVPFKVTPRQMGFTSSNSFLVGSGSVSRTITTTSNAAQVDQTRHSSVSDKLIDSCPLKVWSLLLGLSCCRSPQLRTLQLMGIAVLYLSSHLSPFLCAAYLIIVKVESRLGTRGAEEIKMHPWFNSTEWDKLYEMEAAYRPTVDGEVEGSPSEAPQAGPWRKMLTSKDNNFIGFTFKKSDITRSMENAGADMKSNGSGDASSLISLLGRINMEEDEGGELNQKT